MPDPNRPYFRKEINAAFNKVKAIMHTQAVMRGHGVALYTDVYTGNILRGGDSYDYEHIRSAEDVFMTYRDQLTNKQIAEVVNCDGNVAVTLRVINKSKGKERLEDWLANDYNITNFDIDLNLAMSALKQADKAIKNKVGYMLLGSSLIK